jgi:hypothetical protein
MFSFCSRFTIPTVAADKTDKGDSVEVHTFLLFCLFVSGTGKRVGAAPQARSCFSGGTETGEPEPKGARAKQKLRRRRAPQKPRSSAETNGQDRGLDRTEHHAAGGSSRRNCAIQTIPIGEHRTGSRRRRSRSGSDTCVVRKLARPGILSKDHATTRCIRE